MCDNCGVFTSRNEGVGTIMSLYIIDVRVCASRQLKVRLDPHTIRARFAICLFLLSIHKSLLKDSVHPIFLFPH